MTCFRMTCPRINGTPQVDGSDLGLESVGVNTTPALLELLFQYAVRAV